MASTVEQVTDFRGVMVKLGLGQPLARAFTVGVATAGILYVVGKPCASFREDGSMKPFKYLSAEPDATTTHFLLCPLAAAAAAFLFT